MELMRYLQFLYIAKHFHMRRIKIYKDRPMLFSRRSCTTTRFCYSHDNRVLFSFDRRSHKL